MSQPSINWIRDKTGALRLFKHNHDLYSPELAEANDEIVVLKAKVRIRRWIIVAIPISRDLINDPHAGDWSLGRLNDEALHAAELCEREIERGPRLDPYRPELNLNDFDPRDTMEAGPADLPEDFKTPQWDIFRDEPDNFPRSIREGCDDGLCLLKACPRCGPNLIADGVFPCTES